MIAHLEACGKHKAVAKSDDNSERDDGRGHATSKKVLDVEVSLSCSLIFHHDGSCGILVGKSP